MSVRRIPGGQPNFPSRVELYRRSQTIGQDPRGAWNRYRRSAAARPVVDWLSQRSGSRRRCMYCSDSHGGDIEHFVPISVSIPGTFDWRNFLWICTNCNRKKSNRFPVDEAGNPLLLHPAVDDPWQHFILDDRTGVIAARYLPDKTLDRRASTTLDIVEALNWEPPQEARHRVARRLSEVFELVLAEGDNSETRRRVLREVHEDDVGVAPWFAMRVIKNPIRRSRGR